MHINEQLKTNITAAPEVFPDTAYNTAFEEAYTSQRSTEPFPWPEAEASSTSTPGLLHLVEPLAWRGLERLRTGAARLAAEWPQALLFDPDTVADLFLLQLRRRMGAMIARTLTLELQIARLEDRLAGDTSEERFARFTESLRTRQTALQILEHYPVLARLLVEEVQRWEATSLELLSRLQRDSKTIVERFFPAAEPGRLIAVEGGGDSHCGGRSVAKLRFDSGARLIYKPRGLAVERAFQHLLQWIQTKGWPLPFRTLQVLDRGTYGWVEFVQGAPCDSLEALRRFYQRQGGYLALLYLLEGTDFHHENLIAAGEHPVLVDLETLFHPSVHVPDLHAPDPLPGTAIHRSVLAIGLLPNRIWGQDAQQGVDLSGLTSRGEQTTPMPIWAMVDANTDRMRFEKRHQKFNIAQNRPRLAQGETPPVQAFVHDLAAGFEGLYTLLAEHREELLSRDGPLAAFAEAETRVVFRATWGYALLLAECFHPHALSDPSSYQRLLDRLRGGVEHRPYLEALIPAEQGDLSRMDIPFFTTRPGTRDLTTSQGEILPDFFPCSGLDRVHQRLRALGPEDRERQSWLIRRSIQILDLESRKVPERPSYEIHEAEAPASREALLAAARKAGERVSALAFRSGRFCQWMGTHGKGIGQWELEALQPDLYLGLPGIALFLAHLGAQVHGEGTGEDEFTPLARAALATQDHQLQANPESFSNLGGYSGLGGALYAWTHLGLLWRDEELLDQAASWLPEVRRRIAEDEYHDVVAGSAGALMALLGLGRSHPSPTTRAEALQAARLCGEHLLAKALPQAKGLGWLMPVAGERPLTGMSHGAAGIALALLRLYAATGDERFREAALGGIEYERSLYSELERNWPDLRAGAQNLEAHHGQGLDTDPTADPTAGSEHYMSGWCHGAPGIGLARLASLPFLPEDDTDEAEAEIAIAVETTLAEGFGKNHSLCHGDLGNLDFLHEAARQRGDKALLRRVSRHAASVLSSFEEYGFLPGLPLGTEPPGLMVGLSGIGLGLLRLAAPERVPCVLTLELPESTF